MEHNRAFITYFKWSLLSLVIVASYGTIMRYKIAFDLPFFDQKNLLHAHSHFAFSGWVTQTLYCGLTAMLARESLFKRQKVYMWLLRANLIVSLCMLIAFTVQGYGFFSITFSTLTIAIAILFCIFFFQDAKSLNNKAESIRWAKAGLVLNVLSALGPFTLAYIMSSKNYDSEVYLGAIYYFLHFQYNGWFFFGSMALGLALLPAGNFKTNTYFKTFIFTIIPAYGLSVLWAKPPLWLYLLIITATVIQLITWFHFQYQLFRYRKNLSTIVHNVYGRIFIFGALAALSLKFILQAISVIPSLSQLVFGFRPIVIAYLHLVLLGVFTLFLLFYGVTREWVVQNKLFHFSLIVFLTGVLANEFILGAQGLAAFTYTVIPYINELLFSVALVLMLGSILILFSQLLRGRKGVI